MPKKAFVSKKQADSFQLVHRSQRDPLLDSGPDAGQFVLKSLNAPAQPTSLVLPASVLPPTQPEPAAPYRDAPAFAFGSNRFCLEADGDIVDALDAGSEDDYEELDDDFILLANGAAPISAAEAARLELAGCLPMPTDDDDDDTSDADSDAARRSREAARHAAAIAAESARYDQQQQQQDGPDGMRLLLDARFERALERDYASSDESGDDSDADAFADADSDAMSDDVPARNERFEQALDEFLETHAAVTVAPRRPADAASDDDVEVDAGGDAGDRRRAALLASESDEEAMDEVELSEDSDDRWDCESILSTYSTSENRPARIAEPAASSSRSSRRASAAASACPPATIRLSAKSGLPLGVLPSRSIGGPLHPPPQREAVASSSSGSNSSVGRDRDESSDDKKARKAAVKQQRQQARQRKKQLKSMFDSEQRAQQLSRKHRPPSAVLPL
eukprot:TRINITY_DN137_c2_g5_i2.p2 TRINITY_DN137_c2_g5~~TRINITY_DN137_c2_g5_i2.p2  ORF type:complete len:449 (-),score=214.06 TRINITY_DN137_c2_g5_i2:90-1436(-)